MPKSILNVWDKQCIWCINGRVHIEGEEINIYSEKETIQKEIMREKKNAKLGNVAKMVEKGDPRLPFLIMDIPKLKLFSG